MRYVFIGMVVSGLLGLPVSVAAGVEGATSGTAALAALEDRADALRAPHGRKLGAIPRQRIVQDRAVLQELIARLQGGDRVAPAEVARALGRAPAATGERLPVQELRKRENALRARTLGRKLGGPERLRISEQTMALAPLLARVDTGQPLSSYELDRALGRGVPAGDGATPLGALERRAQELRHETTGRKIGGPQRQQIVEHRTEVRALIDRLQSGGSVDPVVLQRALRRSI